MGDNSFFAHIGYTKNSIPVCAQIKATMQDGISVALGAGTDRNHINSGISQFVYSFALSQLTNNGSRCFDFCGANIEPVAKAKAAWGFDLVPYITIVDHSFVGKAKKVVGHVRGARKFWHFIRRKLI